jgi:hypothetical protein
MADGKEMAVQSLSLHGVFMGNAINGRAKDAEHTVARFLDQFQHNPEALIVATRGIIRAAEAHGATQAAWADEQIESD